MTQRAVKFLSVGTVALAAVGAFGQAKGKSLEQIDAHIQAQIAELDAQKMLRTPAQNKIDSNLLFTLQMFRGQRVTKSIARLDTGVTPDAFGMVTVDISADVTPRLLKTLRDRGVQIVNWFAGQSAIRARVSILDLEGFAEMPEIRHINREMPMRTNAVSEGDVAHGANVARSTFGLNGTGIKVGVLSNGVGNLSTSQTNGELPSVQVLDAGSGSEGTAMLEIIHDLAPGASLAFCTANGGEVAFGNNIIALAQAGCNVIVDDIGYLGEGVFRDGYSAQCVDYVTATYGVKYFSSAGNSGRPTYSTPVSGTWEGNYVQSASNLGGSPMHQFPNGSTQNQIGWLSTDSDYLALQWSDPRPVYTTDAGSSNDYDLYTVNSSGTVVSTSNSRQNGDDMPFEYVVINYSTLRAVVTKFSGSARFLHLSLWHQVLMQQTTGVINGHAAANSAFGVGAVGAQSRNTLFNTSDITEYFSSSGPRLMFYNPDGSEVTPGNLLAGGGITRQKPDFSAADGVVTTVPGFNPFYGTSAAAPHAAAIAALLLQHKSTSTFAALKSILTGTAIDIMGAGWDNDSGAGIIMPTPAITRQVDLSLSNLTTPDTTLRTGESGVITVTLDTPAPPSGVTFNISRDPAYFSGPTTVLIPGGSSTANFTLNVANEVTTSSNVTVSYGEGLGAKTITFTKPSALQPPFDHVEFLLPTVYGGQSTKGFVYLTSPAVRRLAVTLVSSKPNIATVPETVYVKTGEMSASFNITTTAPVNPTTVKITAKRQGTPSVNAILTVIHPKLNVFTVTPQTVTSGATTTGEVKINYPAPAGGLDITLTSKDPNRVVVPAKVRIPVGQKSKTFTIKTKAGNPKKVNVIADRDGASITRTITLN